MRKIRKIKKLPRRTNRGQLTQPPDEPADARKPEPPPIPRSRPTRPTEALLETLCERLASGQTGAEVCRDESMPTWNTLCKWRQLDPAFEERYWVARKQGCEHHADEIITIADDGSNDYVARKTLAGGTRLIWDRESFERSRLRVDARKWTAAKILRHLFGEKSEVAVTTPGGVQVDIGIRNQLIESIVKLVSPKNDPDSQPDSKREEPRER